MHINLGYNLFMDNSIIFGAFAISFLCSFFINAVARGIAKKNKILIDLPDKNRKFHKRATPLTGGISIFLGSILAIYLMQIMGIFSIQQTLYQYAILTCGAIIVISFLFDDAIELSSIVRLFIQTLVALICVMWSGTYLINLGDLFGFGYISLNQPLSIIFTTFCIVGVMNAFNMIDGINGLCSGLALVSMIFMGIFYNGFIGTHLIFAVGAIAGFLIFNLGIIGKKRWVFLGDHGSNLLGFLTAMTMIGASQELRYDFSPITALWLIAVPFLDCIGLILKRLLRGVGPFTADRDHLHHKLMDRGYSAKKTLIIILCLSIFASFLGVVIQTLFTDKISFYCFIIFSLGFYYYSHVFSKTSKLELTND
jgi:UDP-GlcNAc:undecaprenyl-phosphate GlcNAc-1-phosphate transferase